MRDFDFEEPKNRMRRQLKGMTAYAIAATLAALTAIGIIVVLILKYNGEEKTLKSEEQELSEIVAEDAALSEEISDLKKTNDKLGEDVEFYSSVMSDSELRAQIMNLFEEGNSAYSVLKKLYPEKMVVPDSGKYLFFDIDSSIAPCEFQEEFFTYDEESRRVGYAPGGEDISSAGIDVSKYNGAVDWPAVAASGMKFAFVRCGIRGYVSGEIVADDFFEENVTGARDAGLTVGAYIFSQAVNKEEAVEEAEFVLENIEGKGVNGPIVCDIEKIDNPDTEPRTLSVSRDERTDIAIAFCERIKEAGYTPMIYGNIYSFLVLLDMQKLEKYDKWFADYITSDDRTPYFAYKFKIWQYLSGGACPGVNGKCDMNIAIY